MGVFDRYKCDGQMNIYDFIEKDASAEGMIWDDDVKEVKRSLEQLAEQFGCTVGKTEFKVWAHVPKLGFRLWMDIQIPKEILTTQEFKAEIENIVEAARDREVELTPMWGACIFWGGSDHVNLSFTTMFLDKKRQRIN